MPSAMAVRTDSPLLFDFPAGPDFSREIQLIAAKGGPVAGVDEAGRGPLAGPVVAAAVILDPDAVPAGLDDSKKLDATRREALFEVILASAQAVAVASVNAPGIDATDIRRASLEAMRRAVLSLVVAPRHVLIDGRDVPPGLACNATALVRGDSLSASIAAASIVAKVSRDRMMTVFGQAHAGWGFEGHKGYGSEAHRMRIATLGGIAGFHRFSFRPLRRD